MIKPRTVIATLVAVVLLLTAAVALLLAARLKGGAADVQAQPIGGGQEAIQPELEPLLPDEDPPVEDDSPPDIDRRLLEYEALMQGSWMYRVEPREVMYLFEFRPDKTLHIYSWDRKYDDVAEDVMDEEVLAYRIRKSGDDYVLDVPYFGDADAPKHFRFDTDSRGNLLLILWQADEGGRRTFDMELVLQE
jgi:hypothetical protein